METIHRVRRDAPLPHFVTLTFPDFFPSQDQAKRKLDTWFKRLKRKWPQTAAVWRMEVIDRKSGVNAGQVAPHFHLLVWGHFERDAAAQMWSEVCGEEGNYAHLKHGTDAEPIRSWNGAVNYCAKYMSKAGSAYEIAGRVWGIHNRAAMPFAPAVRAPLLPRVAWRVRREVRACIRSRLGRRVACQTMYTACPERWKDRVEVVNDERVLVVNSELQILGEMVLREHGNQPRYLARQSQSGAGVSPCASAGESA